MSHIIQWVAANPAAYYATGLCAVCAVVTLVVYGGRPGRSIMTETCFLVAGALMFFAWRWPAFFWPGPLNPDEASFASAALQATVDWAPWRGFDSGTSGPLNSYVLMLPLLFHAQISFFSIRVIAFLLMMTAVMALYYAIKWTHGSRVARLSIVPPLLLFSFTSDADFVNYSSEYLPVFLTTITLAAAAYLASGRDKSPRTIAISAGVAGFCAGAACFAKFQSIPLAAVMFCLALAAVIHWSRGRPRREWASVAAALCAGLFTVPVLMLASIWWTGVWSDAFLMYIRMNLDYSALGRTGVGLSFFFGTSKTYAVFLGCSLGVLLIACFFLGRRRMFDRDSVSASVISLLLLVTALLIIHRPHRAFPHYLLFSVFPLTCCLASALRLTRDANWWLGRETTLSITYVLFFLVSYLSVMLSTPSDLIGKLAWNAGFPISPEVRAIARYAKPGDSICVWGWTSDYYVQTGTISAARSTETAREIEPSPYCEFFRRRYLEDIQKRKPVVFVDSVGPTAFFYKDRARHAHEIFPALAEYVRDNYLLKEEIGNSRIYVSKAQPSS